MTEIVAVLGAVLLVGLGAVLGLRVRGRSASGDMVTRPPVARPAAGGDAAVSAAPLGPTTLIGRWPRPGP
jgi:hypothetical protein